MSDTVLFSQLGLNPQIESTLQSLGYETPTPVQAQSIPIFLNGHDLLAQAQTGTGKTAAFALPILSQIDLAIKAPQAIIIAPTRELAIQVAEAFQSYAKGLRGFHVAPIYGGQDYRTQLRALDRGTHVIVGTPGRVMDHLKRGSLKTNHIKTLVLDEADEMLKMGFIDDIEWILEQIKQEHQTGLFSATMPDRIRNITKKYLHNPKHVHIQPKETTLTNIEQFHIVVKREQKLEALTRLLEIEDVKAAVIFSRTKTFSTELAEKLQARGYAAAALNGDMNQSQREKVLGKIKKGELDIIVATDVAARGIDIERMSHVINYDIPHDTESYIHRIGRTGRAGRSGRAILFVAPRERYLLKDIERAVKTDIKPLTPPSIEQLAKRRSEQLSETLKNIVVKSKKLGPYHTMIDTIVSETGCEPKDIAAALAYLNQQANPLPTEDLDKPSKEQDRNRDRSRDRNRDRDRDRGKSKFKPKSKSNKKFSNKNGFEHRKASKSNAGKPAGKPSRPPKRRAKQR